MKNLFIVLLSVLFLSVGLAQTHQHEKQTMKTKTVSAKETYSCPMHPEIKSDKPGKCPKCGMNLVAAQKHDGHGEDKSSASSAVKEKVQKARKLLDDAKRELVQNGDYNCCIKDPCDECLVGHQSCECAENATAGKPVCGSCYAGWQRGDGLVPGVKKEKIKGDFHSHQHKN